MAVLLPNDRGTCKVLCIGLVLSFWVSIRKPKLATSPSPICHVVAARVVEMTEKTDSPDQFSCNAFSRPWVVRPELIVAILGAKTFSDELEECHVQLCEESMAVISSLKQLGQLNYYCKIVCSFFVVHWDCMVCFFFVALGIPGVFFGIFCDASKFSESELEDIRIVQKCSEYIRLISNIYKDIKGMTWYECVHG